MTIWLIALVHFGVRVNEVIPKRTGYQVKPLPDQVLRTSNTPNRSILATKESLLSIFNFYFYFPLPPDCSWQDIR